eukprot:CAMPEP_0174756668 /NCGR_PEP_ID=MMETSP1094-20130205/106872_1 /TAXON_ID=156173 /ORGANISM="Chrysochromulina brevifilum, Strain UTEX LB 985" /LENGTH=221 /DNA_ID=CAMNT_0015962577 /DNA_START=554 /DNA_END=1219 /DNA_ORIENTATION=-
MCELHCVRCIVYGAGADTPSLKRLTGVHATLEAMHEEGCGSFLAWKEKGWPRLMWLKCEVMRRALSSHRFVIFTDGDIVYERRGGLAYCVQQLIEGEDAPELLMQRDGMRDDGDDGWGYCAGFMAARSTTATRNAFSVDEGVLTPGWDDQRHLNAIRDSLRLKGLPLSLFPNGQYWSMHKDALRRAWTGPYLIHYNWLVGDAGKRDAMRGDGKWYLGSSGQ